MKREISDEEFEKEFVKKMFDLYNFLRDGYTSGGEIHLSNGIIFKCEMNTTNLINKPVIDLTKLESEGKK